MSFIGEFLGYLAGVCTAIVFLPQTIQTIRERNVNGLSLLTYVIYCVGMVSWILYGVYLHSVQMMLFNSISLFFAAIILYMIVTQRMKKR
ncbi:MAG: SemiSWEET transporter [Rhodospirillales bacterium]|nr:SemiSWEET transporter [Rhodospirillales bacterium]